jgi:hypothetical protein
MEFKGLDFLRIGGFIEKFSYGFDKKVSCRFKWKRNADK